jgi:hypothetical protein
MSMSGLEKYHARRKEYEKRFGHNPPKGMKLPEIEKALGYSGKSTSKKTGCSCKHGKSDSALSKTKRASLWRF